MHSEFRFRNFQILDISDVIKIYKTQKNENTNFQFYQKMSKCAEIVASLNKKQSSFAGEKLS